MGGSPELLRGQGCAQGICPNVHFMSRLALNLSLESW